MEKSYESIFRNCDNPQFVPAQTGVYGGHDGKGKIPQPCGHCWACMGRKAHKKAGQFLAECFYPYSELWREPGWMQFWTLTYPESCVPMTEPEAHDLSLNRTQTGIYTGPFIRREGPKRPIIYNGEPYWKNRGRLDDKLTESEIIQEQINYLTTYLGWDPKQVTAWENGTYNPVTTLRIKHIQDFMKRLRIWQSRHYPDMPQLRFAYTGEYGDQRGRAHYHLILFGYPPYQDAQEYLVDSWQNYHDGAIVDPKKRDAIHFQASHLDIQKGAARYTTKDIVKGRRRNNATPELAARIDPFVRQSLKPPLGQVAMEIWLARDIYPIIEKFPNDLESCYEVRKRYVQHTLHMGPKRETFTTTEHWRGQVQTLYKPEDWQETTERINAEIVETLLALKLEGKFEGMLNEHRSTIGQKNRRNEKRTLDRKRRKAALRFSSERL